MRRCAELVVDAIERSILRGEIEAGQHLAERELAEQLGVSKTPVREALKELGRRGLVVSVPYRGAHVRAVDPEQARNIYSVRLLLEPEAVRLATPEQTDATLAACHAALADAADAAEHGEVADISSPTGASTGRSTSPVRTMFSSSSSTRSRTGWR